MSIHLLIHVVSGNMYNILHVSIELSADVAPETTKAPPALGPDIGRIGSIKKSPVVCAMKIWHDSQFCGIFVRWFKDHQRQKWDMFFWIENGNPIQKRIQRMFKRI